MNRSKVYRSFTINIDVRYLLVVEIDNSKHLHSLHKDLPLLPWKIKIRKTIKLACNLCDKENYCAHNFAIFSYKTKKFLHWFLFWTSNLQKIYLAKKFFCFYCFSSFFFFFSYSSFFLTYLLIKLKYTKCCGNCIMKLRATVVWKGCLNWIGELLELRKWLA